MHPQRVTGMNQWMALNAPPLVAAWMQQHAEPLLEQYLEGWMTINATQLLTTLVTRQTQLNHRMQANNNGSTGTGASNACAECEWYHQHHHHHQQHHRHHASGSGSGRHGHHQHQQQQPAVTAAASSPATTAAGSGMPVQSAYASASRSPPPARIMSMHQRPLGLGLGIGRGASPSPLDGSREQQQHQPHSPSTSPTGSSSGHHQLSMLPLLKGPLAEVLHQATSPLPPGEEAITASPSASAGSALGGNPHSSGLSHGQLQMLQQQLLASGGGSGGGSGNSSQNGSRVGSPLQGASGASARRGSLGFATQMAATMAHSAGGLGGVPSSVLQNPQADVLLVEDVRVAQLLAHASLTRAHFRVEIAATGEIALEKYRMLLAAQQSAPGGVVHLKLVLMDISLPGMSGIEVTERIRRMEADAIAQANAIAAAAQSQGQGPTNSPLRLPPPPPPPVHIYGLTGSTDPEDLARYARAGMNGCILKGRVLVDSVRLAIEESERNPHAFINMTGTTAANTVQPMITLPSPHTRIQQNASMGASHSPMHMSAPASPVPGSPFSSGSSAVATRAVGPVHGHGQIGSGGGGAAGHDASLGTPDFSALTVATPSPLPIMQGGASGVQQHTASSSSSSPMANWRSMGVSGGLPAAALAMGRHTNSPPPPQGQGHAASTMHLTPKRLLGMGLGSGSGGSAIGGFIHSPVGGGGSPTSGSLSGSKRTLAAMHDGGGGGGGGMFSATLPSAGPSSRSIISTNALHSSSSAGGAGAGTAAAMTTSAAPWASPVGVTAVVSHTSAAATPPVTSSPTHAASPLASVGSSGSTPSTASPNSPMLGASLGGSGGSGSGGGFDVLLVEDVRVAQRIAARALQTAHYRVDVASSGEAAVERFRAHRRTLKLVLMDINLPGIDGIAATEQIRRIETEAQEAEETAARAQQQEQTQEQQQHQQPQQTPSSLLSSSPVLVLGLTGNVDESNLRLYEQAGMNGCIVKGRQLGDAVRQAVRMWHERPGTFINLVSSSAFAPLPAAASASPASSSSASGSPAVAASPIVQTSPSENVVAAAAASGSSSSARSGGCGCGCSCVDHCACPSNCTCATACPLTKRARRGHTDTTASTHNGADGHSEDGNTPSSSNSDTRMH